MPLSPAGRLDQTGDVTSADALLAPRIATGAAIATAYGGVLYLLNAALRLGFYPDFTRPQDAGLALSPWAFLALSGECLAGRGLRDDALWTLLEALAGHADESTLLAPAASKPPPFPDALRAYFVARRQRPAQTPDTWAAWIEQLIPPLRRRLAAALGVSSRAVGGLLCRQAAHLRYRCGLLDVHFSLNDHPVAIRRAGLDRDPGWIPAAACDIRFFYNA